MALDPQEMVNEMETQLRALWRTHYGHELSGVGQEQRNILFLAIARGVLKYLMDREEAPDHLFSHITLSRRGVTRRYTVDNLEWNITIPDMP